MGLSFASRNLFYQAKPDGRYGLFVGSECFGSYSNPVQAADDVYLHVTGCTEWDMLDGQVPGAPTDLGEWEKV